MSDRERHVFDMRFRRAVNAYDRFALALRDVSECWQDDEYPEDWGIMVQQVMAHIRTAKMLLTRAMSDAEPVIRDSTVEQDELMELRQSIAGLNTRLQHVDSAEAALMNSILRGDGDYVSMFIASQRVQQEMEERIQQTVRGTVPEDAPKEQPEEQEADGDEPEDGPETVSDEVSEEQESEESPEEPEQETEDETAPEEQPADVQRSTPYDDLDGFHEKAMRYGAEAIAEGTYDIPEGAEEEHFDSDDGTGDDPEAPIIMSVPQEPDETEPRGLTTEEKVALIRDDPELQRMIHDAAQDIAIRQVRTMIEDAKAAAQQQSVMEREQPVDSKPAPVVVTERGRDMTPDELAGASGGKPEASEPSGFVGRIRGKKVDKPKEKPSKPRRIRKNAGGEQ